MLFCGQALLSLFFLDSYSISSTWVSGQTLIFYITSYNITMCNEYTWKYSQVPLLDLPIGCVSHQHYRFFSTRLVCKLSILYWCLFFSFSINPRTNTALGTLFSMDALSRNAISSESSSKLKRQLRCDFAYFSACSSSFLMVWWLYSMSCKLDRQ